MYNFGPLAAQDDIQLLEYFHITGQVKRLMDTEQRSPNCIFIARPGAGKTALVKWLESQSESRQMIFIRPSQIQLVAPDDDFSLEDNRILIRAELFTGIISELLDREVLPHNIRGKCSAYMKKEWGNSVKSFFKDKFEGISILGCGFTLKASDRRNYLGVLKRRRTLDKVSELVKEISTSISPVVVSDDPEAMVSRGLQYITPENAMRNGAYLSVMSHLHGLGCQVMLFVKEHVIQSVFKDYPDSSHFEDRLEGLEWKASDLLELLSLRLSTRIKKEWNEVFSFSRKTMEKDVFPFLVNGPRDLLFVCNSAGRSSKKISKAAIQRNLGSLRNNKWNEIRKHFGVQWPMIADFAQAILSALSEKKKLDRISREEFKKTIENAFQHSGSPLHSLRHEQQWINTCIWGLPTVDERLFFIGCLGYLAGRNLVYPWCGRSLEEFRESLMLFTSPLFR